MPKSTTATFPLLEGILTQARRLEKEMFDMTAELDSKKSEISEYVLKFNTERETLFKEELQRRNINWCTACQKVFPKKDLKFVWIEGREKSGGDVSCRWFDFSFFHRACSTCRRVFFAKHGMCEEDETYHDRQTFFAYAVEIRSGTEAYYRLDSDTNLNLSPHDLDKLKFPGKYLSNRLADQWGIPKALEFEQYGYFPKIKEFV